jgi:serine/threonine-protein kinase RsbW
VQSSNLSFSIPNNLAEVSPACLRIQTFLNEHDAHARVVYCTQLVFEELVTNIIQHAFSDDQRHEINIGVMLDNDSVRMTVEDDGDAFDPDCWQPDSPASLEEAGPGGRGLLLVRRMSDDFSMNRESDHNVCRVRIAVPVDNKEQ